MLSHEETELLCRVGPGTPMGNLLRLYWIPAIRSDELPRPDCPPLRVRLLGENLIGFRTSSGSVGLIQNACPHRGASLFFGRNEDEGLRCVYHGWKFAVDGACIDMPSEPAESNFRSKVRATAYPCIERGGVVWAYMGPQVEPPPLPELEANMLPDGQFSVSNVMRDCNWMQALEGDIDTVHTAFLHGGHRPSKERAARYAVQDTDYGVSYGAYRDAESDDGYYWRIAHFLFPFYTMVPTGTLGLQKYVRAWVPVDDSHTLFFRMTLSRGAESPPFGSSLDGELMPASTDWYGRFRARPNAENDYLLDREAQRTMKTYAGLPSHTIEDQAVTESMGPILDRSKEHLGTSDSMIIRTRRRLLEATKALRDAGVLPPCVQNEKLYGQRSGGVVLPKSADWWEATRELRKAFVSHDGLKPLVGA